MIRAVLNFNPPLLRQAVRGFWWRVTGLRFFIALAAVAIGLVVSIHEGDTFWVTGVLSSVLVAGILFSVALYVVHHRNTFQKLRDMGSPQATLEASDNTLSLSSGAGSASIPWAAVVEIWQLKDCWLLLLSKSQFFTLPLADVTPELKAFILAKVQVSGGRVS
ncbi:YcxB family protein [Dyella silvae]|uniref:YcxB family protein n=1 Tax=Dyella silvae TaxID=2994424 RepID=UPI0022647D56|nr:YcxB family protein [Dyella silvae]